jgi:hypothetical protein
MGFLLTLTAWAGHQPLLANGDHRLADLLLLAGRQLCPELAGDNGAAQRLRSSQGNGAGGHLEC